MTTGDFSHPALDAAAASGQIDICDTAQIKTRIHISGTNNTLVIGGHTIVVAFAPAGFAATVPVLEPGSPAAITIVGNDNVVTIGSHVHLGVNLVVRGTGNRVQIGDQCHLHGFINVLTDAAQLVIGAKTSMVQGSIQLHEAGTIRFGEDCMISSQVYVSLSDIHPIYDGADGTRINPAADIEIGDHVWLGLRCMVMKGSNIGSGSVVAAGAIVSGDFEADAVLAGMPARIVRRNVVWKRDFAEAPPAPKGLPASNG